ncbi:LytTR family DNA-binding domain-containing protein [Ruminococcus sp. HUN007]|uniref:LytR/AlgR family response regulator transcription factor n=1 Tax=Ruminococcus sp. HUN007 TaxID=1514668 RepID=UPI000678ED5A|nr:LytTR family DNA-binding domain-containing protein [Ruminococcus sp. HUN007]
MLIAICDDSKKDAEMIKFSLMDITDEIEIFWFSTGAELIDSIKSGTFYTLIFQDVYLENEIGVDIAKTVKELSPDTQIIFVTTSLDHAIDAFRVQAIDYLVKPCSEAEVVKAFSRVTMRINKPSSSSVVLNSGKNIRIFYPENVIKIESDRHYTNIYCKNKKTERLLIKFSRVAESFDKNFIEIRRGLLVNPEFIERITGATVILSDGSTYILPKAKKDSVITQYTDYVTNQSGI